MNQLDYVALAFVAIVSFFIGYYARPTVSEETIKAVVRAVFKAQDKVIIYSDQPFKRPCKHEGGYCKDNEMFDVCPVDDPTQKVTCWAAGVFENDPADGEMSVDLGGP